MKLARCSIYCFVVLCAILVVTACNPTSVNRNKHIDATSGACDTGLSGRYRTLTSGIDDPYTLSIKIRSFYNQTPKDCHPVIATAVLENLFDLVYNYHATDTVILPFLNHLAASEELTGTQRRRALFNTAAYYLYAQKQADLALPFLKKSERLTIPISDTSRKNYHSLMAEYMRQKSRLKEASDHYIQTIKICEKMGDSAAMAASYANYGNLFSDMGQHEKSIEMKSRSVAYFLQKQQKNNLLIGYVGIGVEYGLLRRYDSSMAYYQKAVALTEEGVHNSNIEFDLYISMGGISLGKSEYDTARYYYSKARETLDLPKNPERQQVYVMASTPAFAGIRNVDREIELIKSYIPSFYADSNLHNLKDAYYTLYHIYYLQDKNDLALKNYERYDSVKSALAREENQQYAAEMEAKYETQKKELRIQVQEKEIKRNNILNGLLIALLLIVLLAAAFIITRFKLKRKKKEAELQQQFTRRLLNNTEEERERIAKDLHDGISQELLILKQQMRTDQQHTNDKIDAIIHEIRMISRDLHPVMLDKIGLKLSVEHICQQMMESNLLFITADITYHTSLSKSVELQLFRMIQEALNNIVKYAAAQAAKVTIRETTTHVITEIMDNGKGFDVAAAMHNKMSFGLLNLTERSKALNGKTEITSSPAGTVVKIEIPKLGA